MATRVHRSKWIMPALAAAVALAASASWADIAGTGDVSPANPSTWTASTIGYIGNTATGTVIVNNGSALLSSTSYLGNSTGATGTVTVNGPGSTWTNSNWLYAGYSGTGILSLTNGGTVSSLFCALGYNTGATGTATIDGSGSKWTNSRFLYVGDSGTGTLTITNGGQVNSSSSMYSSILGLNTGATGIATVDGPGSTWTNNPNLFVGYSGTGTLNITNGGNVSFINQGSIGLATGATGTVTVDGPGSKWTTSRGAINVGYSGTGTLNITNGGQANSFYGYLGYNTGATGTVTVDGPSSMWINNYDLDVGYSGTGTLNITNGGKVTVTRTTYVAYDDSTAMGSINFGTNGGILTTQSLYAGPAQLTGTGTVNTCGLASDGNLVFDASHGLNQTLTWNNASQNVTIHLDMTGGSGPVGDLGGGYLGNGTLTIQNGVAVTSNNGYLGYQTGSYGIATVSGTGSTWTNSNSLYVGYSGMGTLNITNGGQAYGDGDLASNNGAMGTVTVNGTGSTWTCYSSLYVGDSGTGTLTITNGGLVNCDNVFGTYLGNNTGSAGTVFVDGPGSMWNISGGSLGIGYSGTGTLKITHGGLISSSGGYLGYNAGSTGAVTVDGSGSTWTNSSYLYVGYSGSGTLKITNGGQVSNSYGYLGYLHNSTGATGTVTVDGPGSKWTASFLTVGDFGTGTLKITNGGQVNSSYSGYLGLRAGSTGTAAVDGPGSTWTNSGILYIGSSGTGTLKITNGGQVTANGVSINSQSLLAMNVGDGSNLNASSGSLSNAGTILCKAVPGLAAGTYTPITASTWSGFGTTQALGGSWNSTAHTFIVTAAANGTTGQAVTINQLLNQRVFVTDPGSGASVEAGFQATTITSNLTMNAMTLTQAQTALLQSNLAAGGAVVGGWTFTASGYTAGDPVFLSLGIGSGYAANNLAIWHYDGAVWTPYAAGDLSYDGTYADFTVTGFSGYAVAAPIMATSINAGVTQLSANNMLPKITDLTVNGGTLDLHGYNQQLNSLSDGGVNTGRVTNSSLTASTLTLSPARPTSTTFGGVISGNLALVMANAGTTTLTGAANYSGPTIISAGMLAFGGGVSHSIGGVSGAGTLQVEAGTTLNSQAVTLAGLTVNGTHVITAGSGVNTVTNLSLAGSGPSSWTGLLDLTNNSLIVHNGGNVAGQIKQAENGGLWNGTAGITSSTVVASVSTTTKLALGYATGTEYSALNGGSTTFAGQPIIGTDELVKPTLAGDASLDGTVNFSDFLAMLGDYTKPGDWSQGDFNGDGVVNFSDFLAMLGNYNHSYSPAPIVTQAADSSSALGIAPNAAVPEPGSLVVLGLGAVGLLGRRRRDEGKGGRGKGSLES